MDLLQRFTHGEIDAFETRADISMLVSKFPDNHREHFLSMMQLLEGVAKKDDLKVKGALERLGRAASLTREATTEVTKWLQAPFRQRFSPAAQHVAMTNLHSYQSTTTASSGKERKLTSRFMGVYKSLGSQIPPAASPQQILPMEINDILSDVRPVLWGKRLALYAGLDLLAAAYAFALMEHWVGWAECRNPNCGKFFRQNRPDQKWCTNACGNRYRVRKSQRQNPKSTR